MASTADPPLRLVQGLLLFGAVLMGLLAGLDPKYALAAALGLAFMAVVMSDLAVGICLFALISFLDLLPVGGGATTFAKLGGLLLLLSWLAAITRSQESTRAFFSAHPFASYLLVLFLGWAALSLLWAEDPGAALTSLERYALSMVLFLIVFTALRDRRHVVWLLVALLAGATVSAMYGIVAPQPPVEFEEVSRLGGAGVDPNQLAATLVASLALAAAFAAGWRREPMVRMAAVAVIGFCALSVFLSLSRGGLVAMGAALIVAVLTGGRWRAGAAVLLAAVVIGGVAYFSAVATTQERERITESNGGTGREDVWAVGWRMVQSSPVNGVGVGNFPVSSIHYLLVPGGLQRSEFIVDEPKVAHNMYLEVLAELGVVGLALFLSIFGFSVACAARAVGAFRRAGDTRMELVARALIVAIVALMAADVFISDQFSKQLWLLLALGPTLMAIARTEESEHVASTAAA